MPRSCRDFVTLHGSTPRVLISSSPKAARSMRVEITQTQTMPSLANLSRLKTFIPLCNSAAGKTILRLPSLSPSPSAASTTWYLVAPPSHAGLQLRPGSSDSEEEIVIIEDPEFAEPVWDVPPIDDPGLVDRTANPATDQPDPSVPPPPLDVLPRRDPRDADPNGKCVPPPPPFP